MDRYLQLEFLQLKQNNNGKKKGMESPNFHGSYIFNVPQLILDLSLMKLIKNKGCYKPIKSIL